MCVCVVCACVHVCIYTNMLIEMLSGIHMCQVHIWGDVHSLIWGDVHTLIWGDVHTLIWGDVHTLLRW